MSRYTASFIGCGNMGGTLAAVAAKSVGGEQILVADHNPDKLERLQREYGTVCGDAREAAKNSAFVFLGVKPQGMQTAADEIRTILAGRTDRFIIVTMAAGLTTTAISELLGGCPVIRIMPNTPAAVGEGVILYCTGPDVTVEEEEVFVGLIRPAGMTIRLEENKIDMASAVTGCGPAFVCAFLEAMIDGAVRCGLSRDKAAQLAEQTVAGTAKLALRSGQDPALLRTAVCSPAGSTIEGIAALEQHAFRFAVMEAISAACRRTVELGKQ